MSAQYLIATLGCKVNQYESQQIRETLESCGLRPARRAENATVAVVNTCAVTAGASRKNRQTIRRLARDGATPVVVVGCGATADAEQLRKLSGVVAVLGHDTDVTEALRTLLTEQLGFRPTASTGDADGVGQTTPERPDASGNDGWMMPGVPGSGRRNSKRLSKANNHPIPHLPVVKNEHTLAARIHSFEGHQRAFLKVQDGCDAFCTYCIIPQLRSAMRSKRVEAAVEEARGLVAAGHREIIVTGIFLGAYGRETAIRKRWGPHRSPLADLVDALAQVEGLARLRLSSLEPGDVDGSLLEVLARHDTCVPHLHLPLQSGSAAILRRMNRQYTRDQFIDMIQRVRAALDRPAISTDIIVGFPGETDADFQNSLEISRLAEFVKIHAFPFSPRDKTAAARWQKDFVPPPVVRERMNRLADLERELSLSFRRRLIGTTERIIIEGDGAFDPTDAEYIPMLHGRTDRYFEVHFEPLTVPRHDTSFSNAINNPAPDGDVNPSLDTLQPGDIARVRIDRVTPTRTHGTYIDPRERACPLPVLAADDPGPARMHS